jgi:hypothetical protein
VGLSPCVCYTFQAASDGSGGWIISIISEDDGTDCSTTTDWTLGGDGYYTRVICQSVDYFTPDPGEP